MALPLYGTGAYPYVSSVDTRATNYIGHDVGGPIGGGAGYLHYYTQAAATYVINQSTNDLRLAALKSALSSATSGQIIFIPTGYDISSSGRLGTLKAGAILASDRGYLGHAGAKLTLTANIPGTYQEGFLEVSTGSHVSGLVFQGPSATSGLNCAIDCGSSTGVTKVEVENCWIDKFDNGGFHTRGASGVYWSGSEWVNAHFIHHCYIAHCQRGGMGYGISSAEGKCPYWSHCNIFRDNRHHTMVNPASGGNGYEASYCDFGDAWNNRYATGDPQHQVDWHGVGSSTSTNAADYARVHHCTFSSNDSHTSAKPNCTARGTIVHAIEIDHNWTKKTAHAGLFPKSASDDARYYSTTSPFTGQAYGWCKIKSDGLASQMGEEGGTWAGTADLCAYKMYVHDNWWGVTSPPGEPTTPSGPIAAFSGSPVSGNAPLTVAFVDGSYYSPTSWLWSFGDGTTSTLQNPNHTYESARSYTVSLSVYNSDGSSTETKTDYITVVSDGSVTADFSADPVSGEKPLTVSFINASTNADTYSWAFGDGGTSTDTNPEHTYTAAGTYSPVLEASTSTAATTLDVGAGATNRASAASPAGYTVIMLDNPLNGSGVIDSIESWWTVAATGVKVGLFHGTAPNFTCRAMVEIGALAAGAKETSTLSAGGSPIALQGLAGDYIGIYCTAGTMEYDNAAGSGYYYKLGDFCTVGTTAEYILMADRDYSLYATGSGATAVSSDTETKTDYITVLGNTAPSASYKMRVFLTPKSKLGKFGNQISHAMANSKGGVVN